MIKRKLKNFIIVIPARYKSSRFPGKPLAKILGKTMINRVWEICTKVLPKKKIIIATDDFKIANHCKDIGMLYIMTSSKCLTGTDRIIEVAKKVEADFYINVQGDEPLIKKSDILTVIKEAKKNPNLVLNAMTKIQSKKDYDDVAVPKIVFNKNKELLYASRSPLPGSKNKIYKDGYRQVCIYSFPKNILKKKIPHNKKSRLEKNEDIEILRFIENNVKVKMINVSSSSIAVDFPKDIKRVEKKLNEK